MTRTARMVTTPAGITIGRSYVPPPMPLGSQAQAIQAALLEPRTAQPLTGWRRVFGLIWRIA